MAEDRPITCSGNNKSVNLDITKVAVADMTTKGKYTVTPIDPDNKPYTMVRILGITFTQQGQYLVGDISKGQFFSIEITSPTLTE